MRPNFNQLIKSSKKDKTNLIPIKLALLGDSSTQFLAKSIEGYGVDLGYNVDLY